MSERILLLVVAGMLLCGGNVISQRIGLLPSSVKWQEIRNDSLRIIFPKGEEERAQRVASLMLKLAASDPITTQGRYRPIPVVLQPQTNVSNGYVGLAPYVSEFYLQPFENSFALGSLPWHDLLSIHEYRHVLQVNAANTGLSHIVKMIFGDLAFSGMYALSVPNWYREGDAVYAETKWTQQGRGRLSRFTLPFREKLKEGETWEYYQLRNGSYKEYTPDHYPLGYMMIQYGNHVFGEQTWDTILQEAAAFKDIINPFSTPLLKRYGKRTKAFYQDAMKWYAEKWNVNAGKDYTYPYIKMDTSDLHKVFYDMTYPDVSADGTIYTTIKTFDRTTAIYKIDTLGRKHKVQSLGLQQDPYFDRSGHRFVWTELRFDPRWIRRDKNVIVVFDERTGKKLIIHPRKGFFTPSLDKGGNRIAALHVDQEGNNAIQILDARTGSLLATLPNPQNLYLSYPIWSGDEISIIAIARDDKGRMAIVEEDIATGEIKQITHYSYNILGRPFLHDDWILLTTNLDSLDQVYAVDRNEGVFYRVTSGSFAHYDPAWDASTETIVCSEYHLNGKKIIRLPGNPGKDWKLTGLNDGVKRVEGYASNLLAIAGTPREFEIKKYSPWKNAINVHSWTVVADDPVYDAEVRSDNVLNNISLAGGYEFNRNSNVQGPYANLRLGMWYPVLSLGISRTTENVFDKDRNKYKVTNDNFNAGISLPLVYTIGPYQQVVNLSSTYYKGFSKIRPEIPNVDDFPFHYLTQRIILINSRNQAYRQAMPTWGQRFDLTYTNVADMPVKLLYLSSDLAFPGIHPTHYLLVRGEYLTQKQDENSIHLSNPYAGARGYNGDDGNKQYRIGITYGFPVWYPDKGLGSILYSRRVRLQPFYDLAYSNNKELPGEWMRSVGAELLVDFEFPPLSAGIRYSRLLSAGYAHPNVFEFFIPVQRF